MKSIALSLTAGTPEYINAKHGNSILLVKSASGNAVDVNVGNETAQSFVLSPGEQFAWELRAGDSIYFDAASSTATVYVLASNDFSNG